MNDASRTAEDLRQELLLVGESHHIEAKRCMQVDHSVMEPVCAFAIDNAAYRAINRTDTLNASTHLRRLRDQGLLAMKGSGNRSYYVPGAAFEASPKWAQADDSPASDTHPPQTEMDTTPPENTHQSTANTHHPGPNTHQSLEAQPAALSAALRMRLPAAGTKPRRPVLKRLLLDLCAWQPMSARTLAGLLGRQDQKHLVREFLSPMVAEGLLAYTIPEMENHPDQRYTAATALEAQKT